LINHRSPRTSTTVPGTIMNDPGVAISAISIKIPTMTNANAIQNGSMNENKNLGDIIHCIIDAGWEQFSLRFRLPNSYISHSAIRKRCNHGLLFRLDIGEDIGEG